MLRRTLYALGALCAGLALAASVNGSAAAEQTPKTPRIVLDSVHVTFPTGAQSFPKGPGSANAGVCLVCHSADMVTTQPPLTQDTWKAEVVKMHTAFGCPVSDDRVAELAAYFHRINNGAKK
jgi:cytochrome c553